MASSTSAQVIQYAPGLNGSRTTRPLRTGKEFVLVIGQPRVVQLHWDRIDCNPGDTCRLVVSGSRLGKQPLELIIEAEGPGGLWNPLQTIEAKVDSDGAQAVAEWKFPVPPGHAEAVAAREAARRGSLVQAKWASTEAVAGEPIGVQVEAQGLDGEKLVFLLEREEPDGTWRCIDHCEGTVKDGACRTEWRTPAPPPDPRATAPGELLHCRFEDGHDLSGAQTAWLAAGITGLDGATVEVVLEREGGDGWAPVGNAVSTVKVGQARAGIPLAQP